MGFLGSGNHISCKNLRRFIASYMLKVVGGGGVKNSTGGERGMVDF